MVNLLEADRQRMIKLLFDLKRLDEALVQRAITLSKHGSTDPQVQALTKSFVDLLTTVSSFINMAVTVPGDRAIEAAVIYHDLMKRLKEKE